MQMISMCIHTRFEWTLVNSVARPLWLDNLRDNCLQPALQLRRYLALSYVWGTPKDDKPAVDTTEDNLLELQEDGAFSRGSLDSTQKRSLHRSIQRPVSIRAHIFIAGGGDAYHGLRGTERVTSQRSSNAIMSIPLEQERLESKRTTYNKEDRFKLHRDTDSIKFGPISLSQMLSAIPWSKRAWTLQERIFPQRVIYLFDACVV
ncbi:hypothetical protein BKA61DRAFT_581074 [Leptodontidium sp. MPI-SDFR-AT-0119]|nr:hypothetical protein BKA61DRAFT_581074 [Leptodontidium sp. MPI-SDFR-AT-0119]